MIGQQGFRGREGVLFYLVSLLESVGELVCFGVSGFLHDHVQLGFFPSDEVGRLVDEIGELMRIGRMVVEHIVVALAVDIAAVVAAVPSAHAHGQGLA